MASGPIDRDLPEWLRVACIFTLTFALLVILFSLVSGKAYMKRATGEVEVIDENYVPTFSYPSDDRRMH